MESRAPRPSRTSTSLFVGLWLALTCIAGAIVFVVVFTLWGGLRGASPAQPTAASRPVATQALATAGPAPASTPDEGSGPEGSGGGAEACAYRPDPASGFGYGIQSHVFVGENDFWMGVITDKLNFNWVKMQVRWYDLQQQEGDIWWDVLDSAMNEACRKGLRVMLSVLAAPEWTRAQPLPAPQGQEAPPDDPQLYAEFVGEIIDRYPGRIGAIEVWNEMNLEREWNTAAGVSAADYLALLRAAHATIKTKDPNIIVISGAPAPTGINCRGAYPGCTPDGRPIIVDDVTYLRQFIDAGGLDYADCIGTHSNGTNLPPTADGANPPDKTGYTFTGPWDNPHYSWALRSQVEAYAEILAGRKLQCVTEFGYASPVGDAFPPGYEFAADVTEQEQAEYLVQAFDWMRESGEVRMAFLFNLDYGPKGGDPATDDNVIFSILTREGAPRPAFDALTLMAKP